MENKSSLVAIILVALISIWTISNTLSVKNKNKCSFQLNMYLVIGNYNPFLEIKKI
ncbi:hypothetical protein LL037_18140 [Clostridium estertheticum]|uniref:Uncharacterized protein n=1 Tax=Clostridium estertheticum TaxID=238834 RepID=A0AA47I8I9_9CLOT|nr:hypothetical protein [Clostridium estertheticum]MBU3153720.1 hypothetical protein [Clostridium estertheticum]MBU3200204.1 hypothetical protein [Clostridium estertheticum]WAG61494.1 hypothetical protein LL038_04380 [Clostridium estertheticum]WAG64378.1 hypothetical protein LL037_18140 [Clostridium estertheticum]